MQLGSSTQACCGRRSNSGKVVGMRTWGLGARRCRGATTASAGAQVSGVDSVPTSNSSVSDLTGEVSVLASQDRSER